MYTCLVYVQHMFKNKLSILSRARQTLPPLGAFRSGLLPFNPLATCLAVGVAFTILADPPAILRTSAGPFPSMLYSKLRCLRCLKVFNVPEAKVCGNIISNVSEVYPVHDIYMYIYLYIHTYV